MLAFTTYIISMHTKAVPLLDFKADIQLFFIVFLLASPALSVLPILGFPFFPNEKIAILLVLVSATSWAGYKKLRVSSLFVAAVLFLIISLQSIFEVTEISVAVLNTVVVIISLPFYVAYLSRRTEHALTYIFYVGIIQFVCSVIQQIAMFNGFAEIISYFNNYPEQHSYVYPIGEMGFFYRTSGLFTESSSYAVFQWMAIFSAFAIGLQKNRYYLALLLLMTLEVVFNGSITGYVFALLYILFSGPLRYMALLAVLSVFMGLAVVWWWDVPVDMTGIWAKIMSQFDSVTDETQSVTRLSGALDSIEQSFGNNYRFFIGSGMSWNSPTLDFISLYLRAFGIVGELCLILYLSIILSMGSRCYVIAALGVFMINGHLSTSINIALLAWGVALYQYEQRCSARPVPAWRSGMAPSNNALSL